MRWSGNGWVHMESKGDGKSASKTWQCGGKSRRVEDVDIPNIKYLQVVIKKALQLRPSTPLLIPHMNKKACKVFKYDLPAGTMVLVNVGGLAWDPKLWEDPLELKPERFLEGMPHANTNMRKAYWIGAVQVQVLGMSRCSTHHNVDARSRWNFVEILQMVAPKQLATCRIGYVKSRKGLPFTHSNLLLQFQRLACLLFCDSLEA